MLTKRVLILEDDLETLTRIFEGLTKLENNMIGERLDFALTVFSEYTQVEDYLNKIEEPNFDVILLDRDCKLGGSFHVIKIEKFGADKFIAISTQPEYNATVAKLGIKRIVRKDYEKLSEFSGDLIVEIKSLIKLNEYVSKLNQLIMKVYLDAYQESFSKDRGESWPFECQEVLRNYVLSRPGWQRNPSNDEEVIFNDKTTIDTHIIYNESPGQLMFRIAKSIAWTELNDNKDQINSAMDSQDWTIPFIRQRTE